MALVSGCTGSSQTSTDNSSIEANSQLRSYPVQYVSHAVINPATIAVRFSVKNDGTQNVRPDCNVKMQDVSGTYKGFDVFSLLEDIQPGQSKLIVGQLTITNEGADFADQFSGECTARTTDTESTTGKSVEIYDIQNCSDGDEEGWYWGACFKARVAPMTQMDCEVTAFNEDGDIVGTHAYRANTGNTGQTTSYGQNERWYVDAPKSVVKTVRTFQVSCNL